VKISLRRTDDIEEVKALHTLCFPTDVWESSSKRHAYWIAKDETGTAVGFCIAKRLASERCVFLERAGVLPIANGRGLQRRMIRARLRWARSEGFTAVITYTTYHNWQSIVNLLREGFRFYSPEDPWVGTNVHYFIREIEPHGRPAEK
jgi:GNAT superfamily N-acetyltransferase